MKICLIFLSGGKKGTIDCLIDGPVTLGTGRKNDIKFGRATDRKISLDHAIITDDRGDIYVSDRRSRSGTFVNGEKITNRTLLKDWDVVELGRNGTRFVFRQNETPKINSKTGDVMDEEMMKIIHSSLLKLKGAKTGKLDPSSEFFKKLISRSVKRSTRRFKIATSMMTILLVIVISLWIVQTIREGDRYREETELRIAGINTAWEEKIQALDQKNSLFSESATAREAELKARVFDLEENLKSSSVRDSSQGRALARELQRVKKELEKARGEMMKNSRIDWVGISKKSQKSVALIGNLYQIYDKRSGKPLMITGKDKSGKPIIQIGGQGMPLRYTATGTGFNIDPKGIFVTNKHVVKPWEMEKIFIDRGLIGKTLKLQVIFADTNKRLDCEIYRESNKHDIIILKMKNPANKKYPYVNRFQADTAKLHQGQEIAVIGFPGNVKSEGKAVTTLTVGVLSKVPLSADLQYNAQINPGNSGGPLINSVGRIIGIVYGAGISQSGQRLQGISYAIPIKYGLELLKK